MKHPVIVLITDFGLDDVYVGVMKGVMLSIAPDAAIVDVTHSIPRHDVVAASHALLACYRFFGEGTVFVVVVDPGVGSERHVICARSEGRYFLAPDNGVLAPQLTERGYDSLVRVKREDLYLKPVSSTFHGRDIFAPVAAHLSMGLDILTLGDTAPDFVRVDLPEAEVGEGRVRAAVRWVDSFGNVVTNCAASAVRDVLGGWAGMVIGREAARVRTGTKYDSLKGEGGARSAIGPGGRAVGPAQRISLVGAYEEVPPGALLAIVGSSGFLEISVREGSAAERLGLSLGDKVIFTEIREA